MKAPMLFVLAWMAGWCPARTLADQGQFFEARIRPIFLSRCVECHGPKERKNKLRVDSLAALLKGGKSGPALVPGKPEKSLLIAAVRRVDKELRMPPKVVLARHEVEALETWVKAGAFWPQQSGPVLDSRDHWAFKTPIKTKPPVDPLGWASSSIDRFTAARLREKNLRPVKEATREALLRRVYFDLIGLPPEPHQVSEFLAENSAHAWGRLVDKLLASPRYGERWGRHWLDVARYADTSGNNSDYPIPEARLYRDYVIDSFNADKPYDQFLREQLAGDILAGRGPPERYGEQVIATGFLGLARRFGTYMDEAPELVIEDTLDTIGRGLMGLTLKCARCHDHKYDPVTAHDYYALYGIFASTIYPFAGAEQAKQQQRMMPAMPPTELARMTKPQMQNLDAMRKHIEKTLRNSKAARKYQEWQVKADRLLKQINARENRGESAAVLRDELQRIDLLAARFYALNEVAALELKIHDIETQLGVVRAYAVAEGKPTDVRIQKQGDPTRWGPMVRRGFPGFLRVNNAPRIPDDASGRLQLAEWLTRPDHPLTARVMVNRVWQWHFGKPLVATPSNFGVRGAYPTHQRLLDWLAQEFIDSGWSLKQLHRKILMSKTYRLATTGDPENNKIDPGNRWYWRFDRQRLDAESLRDALLHVSGKLDLARPGPHPFPPRSKYDFSQHKPFQAVYPSVHRSVYLMTQRFRRHPFLALFDGPDPNGSTAQRRTSMVPLQALYMMNNDFVRDRADEFAIRLLKFSNSDSRRLEQAHLMAWNRSPREAEKRKAAEFLRLVKIQLERQGRPAIRIEQEAWASYARILFQANAFIFLD